MTPLAICINHTPWRPERVMALGAMLRELGIGLSHRHTASIDRMPFLLNDVDYRARDWQDAKVEWALTQWRWAAQHTETDGHCLFMTDDLHLAPGFLNILGAMIEAHPDTPIGLLSNHPEGPAHFLQSGFHGYRTNSWLVGPAYVLPRRCLVDFLAWFSALPDGRAPGCKGYANDDSSINEWVTKVGRTTWHPIPTIIEHRADLASTVGHGDRYSRERLSWRARRYIDELGSGDFAWAFEPQFLSLARMTFPDFWSNDGPLLALPVT